MSSLSIRSWSRDSITPTCLALLLATVAALAAFASRAQAEVPKKPTLGGTHPASPGTSTTPRVFGTVSKVSASVVDVGVTRTGGARTASSGEEESTIAIFALPGCAGPVVATGSAAELENSGIAVIVAAGSTTSFSATNTDAEGESACSNTISYRQVSDPPGAPTVTGVTPPSPADDNQPFVDGSADAGSTVSIYTDSSCSGPAAAVGPAAAFAGEGIPVSVADNSTTTFYARASWAELPSVCSSTSIIYQEMSDVSSAPPPLTPPLSPPSPGGSDEPAIASGRPVAPGIHTVPGGRANSSTPMIVGSAPGAVGVDVFKNAACAGRPIASGTPEQFAVGFAVPVAENAVTRFSAQSMDAAGRVSACSDQAAYTEDSTPPQTRVTVGPAAKTIRRVAVFRFADVSDDPPGTAFVCRLDNRRWQACQSPLRLPHLRIKAHVLRIKATDAAGNQEAVGTMRRFKVVRPRH
jgi:hypothetical protein